MLDTIHQVGGHLMALNEWQIQCWTVGLLLQGAIVAVFPEEVIILTIGLLWGCHKISFFPAFISIELGLLPANVFLVILGRKLGRTLFDIRPFCWLLQSDPIDRAIISIQKRGVMTIFMTRFIPTVRGAVYAAVGVSGFCPKQFMKIDAIASLLYVPAVLFLGKNFQTFLFP